MYLTILVTEAAYFDKDNSSVIVYELAPRFKVIWLVFIFGQLWLNWLHVRLREMKTLTLPLHSRLLCIAALADLIWTNNGSARHVLDKAI